MGKDNVPFHSVMFPATLIGTGEKWTMLRHLAATEYLNYENDKFSKSRNVGVFGTDAKETGISSDVWRYYLLSRRPETGDSAFEWKAFIDANNNELLKNLGNFVNRIVKFVNSAIYTSIVPDYNKYPRDEFSRWEAEVDLTIKQYVTEMEAVKIRAGLLTAMRLSALGNKLLQDNALSNKFANEQADKCAAVVGLAMNLVHVLATVFTPFMPMASQSILRQLGLELLIQDDQWNPASVPVGHKINAAEYLFSQIGSSKAQEWRERYGGSKAQKQREEQSARANAKRAEKQSRRE